MPRILAIGDIHGCAISLKNLVKHVHLRRGDQLVTMGDYVDRGPDSKGVLDFLCDLRNCTTLIPLRGNHEIAMLRALDSSSEIEDWLGIGGDATLRSYDTQSLEDIPRAHLEFVETCLPWHEAERHFFVHANAWPDRDLDEQDDSVLFWEALRSAPAWHKSGKTMICGHTPQATGTPKNWGTAVCVDTGACHGGWLTCMDVRTGHYWQANEAGQTRESDLEPSLDDQEEDLW